MSSTSEFSATASRQASGAVRISMQSERVREGRMAVRSEPLLEVARALGGEPVAVVAAFTNQEIGELIAAVKEVADQTTQQIEATMLVLNELREIKSKVSFIELRQANVIASSCLLGRQYSNGSVCVCVCARLITKSFPPGRLGVFSGEYFLIPATPCTKGNPFAD